MRLFGWSGKFYFPEIEIRWPKKNAFDHGNHFTLLFSLQSISGKWERERESARARARGEETFQSVRRSPANSELQSAPISRAPIRWLQSEIAIDASQDRAVDRDLAKIEIVPSIAILISRDRDRRRDLAKRRTRSRRREIALLIAISPSRDRAGSRSRSTARSHDSAISIFARSRSTARSHEASIVISDRSRRTGARKISADWSSEFAGDRWTD